MSKTEILLAGLYASSEILSLPYFKSNGTIQLLLRIINDIRGSKSKND